MSLDARLADLAAEVAALRTLVVARAADGGEPTPFHGWRVRDSIAHLVTIDALAAAALGDGDVFAARQAAFLAGTAPEEPANAGLGSFARIAWFEDAQLGDLDWRTLLARWQDGFDCLTAAARGRGADDRVPWFGGSMKAESLLGARHMEVWAYGQDVFDAFRVRREEGDRIRAVAEFGVKTFGFSFATRDEPVPAVKPFLALRAPGGATWTWNDPQAVDRIAGEATDFCLVATQRRHVDDTGLAVAGPIAARWMTIAQCIAGPPQSGPQPGERRW